MQDITQPLFFTLSIVLNGFTWYINHHLFVEAFASRQSRGMKILYGVCLFCSALGFTSAVVALCQFLYSLYI